MERARFVTPVAALVTCLRDGSMDFFAAVFFLAAPRFAEVLRPVLLRAVDFLTEDFRALDFRAADFRPDDFFVNPDFFDAFLGAALRALFLRAGDLRADDFRALFFLEPARDDFLAAAMIRAPM